MYHYNVSLIEKRVNPILSWGVAIVTLIITPWTSYDSVNIPRLLALLVMGSVVFLAAFPELTTMHKSSFRTTFVLSSFFVLQTILVLIFAPGNKLEQVFGVQGRQTGFLAYLALVMIFLVAAKVSSVDLFQQILRVLIITGTLSIIYGFIQYAGADPVPWKNPFSPVIGFFGNPNFQSAFMGFSAASLSAFILSKSTRILWRILSGIYVISALAVITASDSQQGFLVFGFGLSLAILILFFQTQNLRKFRHLIALGVVVGFLSTMLDILQKSPWQSILYKDSVSYRGDYWRAGWKMTLEHPFVGVGLDSFRDFYYRSRDLVSTTRPAGKNYTDSAHNILLDVSANGGIPFLVLYFALLILTVLSAVRVLKRTQSFEPFFIAILVAWVGYTAQSLISINQLGLAIWGWVTSGLIIGYEVNTRETTSSQVKPQPRMGKARKNGNFSIRVAFGLVLGLTLGLPTYLADADFRSAIKSRNGNKIIATSQKWPQDVIRMNYISGLFLQNKLPDQAIAVSRDAVKQFPNNYNAWQILNSIPNSTENEKAKALEMMLKLNPLYTKFK
ncbi:unannotated protein [freshwater metagenome]|uniref:Unannotated protein n=1 Tax=freshwater metagenome TaxID=449393 RepID=A0A6J7HEL7_9ZZZZ|nr:hypothetical protein [Actinomycetota bacterium]